MKHEDLEGKAGVGSICSVSGEHEDMENLVSSGREGTRTRERYGKEDGREACQSFAWNTSKFLLSLLKDHRQNLVSQVYVSFILTPKPYPGRLGEPGAGQAGYGAGHELVFSPLSWES